MVVRVHKPNISSLRSWRIKGAKSVKFSTKASGPVACEQAPSGEAGKKNSRSEKKKIG